MSYQTLIRFGYTVKRAREYKHLEPSELAGRLGISVSELLAIEAGKRDVSIVHAKAFARELDLTIDELI